MEWLALSIGIGLVVSLVFTEMFGLSVGGMIVPGYLALSFGQPATVVATLVAALLTAWLMHEVDRLAILFGRRRVVLTMVTGFAVAACLRAFVETMFPALDLNSVTSASTSAITSGSESVGGRLIDQESITQWLGGMTVIGFVIPGLVALWISRTGVVQTLSPLIVASALVHLVLVAVGVSA